MKSALAILGPTASGKSALALALSDRYPIEIINVDSAAFYRGLDIGSAKASAADRARVPHHLIDIAAPSDVYSAGRFCQEADACLHAILARGNLPVIVGGTMMYVQALQRGIVSLPKSDPELQAKWRALAGEQGYAHLHYLLQERDPIAALKIHPNDPQRLIRALSVWEQTGKPLSEHWQATKPATTVPMITVGLWVEDRARLHQRIAKRFDEMLNAGLIAEVESLFHRSDLNADLPALRSVGYRQVWQYLSGAYDFATMREKAITATRQLAKRQLTWLRSWEGIRLFDYQSETVMDDVSHEVIQNCL